MLSTAARSHPPSAEDGLFVDGPSLRPLLSAMHIVSPAADGWVCVRPAHAGQACTVHLPSTPDPSHPEPQAAPR